MKKVLLTLCAVAFSFAVMAQQKVPMITSPASHLSALQQKKATKDAIPQWNQISQDVTGVNYFDPTETISTAAIRQSGKAMVIDFSATWCSWCWVMHQNGLLDAIHDQLGDDVEVIWVEADPSTNAAGLTGGSGSQGNWTLVYGTNNQVPYPIIDDPAFANIIGGSSAISGYPTVVFISSEGYWCDVYGTDWGFGPYSASDAVSSIQYLLANSPQPGVAPQGVSIDAPNIGWINQEIGFTVNYVSVDQITGINWTIDGGTPSTATGATATATFSTPGTYTITVEVTNTTGTTTASKTITIREGWEWGDVMSYCEDNEFVSSVGAGSSITWGVKFPAQYMTNRNYLTQVQMYAQYAGDYTIKIYQGGENAPQTLLRTQSFSTNTTESYVAVELAGGVELDPTKNLWVAITNSGAAYPAAGVEYVGDPNGSLVYYNDVWTPVFELNENLQYTWMIKAVTSATAPAFNFTLSGPNNGRSGDALTYEVSGPSGATYNWTFQGANPATASGMIATSTWDNAGTYTVTVNGSLNGANVSHSMNVSITSCDGNSGSNYNEGFENSVDCWTFYDVDNDGYGWMLNSDAGYSLSNTGSGSLMSASFINGIGALSPDNWAISPKIDMPSGDSYIEWWSGALDASYANDYYSVLVSTTNNDRSSFTKQIYAGPNESGNFTKHSISLSQFAGQSIYVAFRHHNCTDVYWLSIDDLKISTGTAGINDVENSSIDFYPNPVNDKLYISEEVNEVSIVDIDGRTVITANNTKVVDMSKLSNGVYFARVITDNGITTKKIVKR